MATKFPKPIHSKDFTGFQPQGLKSSHSSNKIQNVGSQEFTEFIIRGLFIYECKDIYIYIYIYNFGKKKKL